MGNNNLYFYISGFISLSLFFLFAYLITFTLFSKKDINIFALKKDNYISISLDTSKTNTIPKKNVSNPVVKESAIEQNDIDVDDLFSDVWTKSIKEKDEPEKNSENQRVIEIGKKFKKIDKNKTKSSLNKYTDNNLADKNDNSKTTSSASEVNEYLAKIQALVYRNFIPPQNSQGYTVKAVIELSSIGKVMDFRILTYSENTSLNEECDKIKDRLMSVLFPVNPQNKTGSYIIMLTAKE